MSFRAAGWLAGVRLPLPCCGSLFFHSITAPIYSLADTRILLQTCCPATPTHTPLHPTPTHPNTPTSLWCNRCWLVPVPSPPTHTPSQTLPTHALAMQAVLDGLWEQYGDDVDGWPDEVVASLARRTKEVTLQVRA